jgi:hypothetical protein
MRRSPVALLIALAAALACLPAAASAAAPTISYQSPSEIRNHEATLHFSIDPEGLDTRYWVEYGETESYEGGEAGLYHWELPAGDEPVERKELLSVWGVAQGTTYHYRVVAENEDGTTYGDDQVVTTTDEPGPAAVVTGRAIDLTPTSAILRGKVNPGGRPVTVCRFHYVTQSQYGRFGFTNPYNPRPDPIGVLVPCEETPAEIGDGDKFVRVHAVVSNHLPGPHQFRLEAENAYDAAVPGAASPLGFMLPWTTYPVTMPPAAEGPPAAEPPVKKQVHKKRNKRQRPRVRHNSPIRCACG